MKTSELKKELESLKKALKENRISVNDYCSMYYSISHRIKKLEL